jgi:polyisoprenoid-binding protein YceI
LKGITRDIVVPVTIRREGAGTRVAEGSFVLRRLDFKLGEGQWADPDMVANDVSVRVRIVLA